MFCIRLIGLFLFASSFNQDPRVVEIPDPPCPIIQIKYDGEGECGGNNCKLMVEVTGAGPQVKPSYTWCVSGGTITRGQRTDRIEVDLSELPDDGWVTVVVMIGGLDGACENYVTRRIVRRNM